MKIIDMEICPGCNGNGVQKGIDGIVIRCPICFGTGKWQKEMDWDEFQKYWKENNWCPMCERRIRDEKDN